MREIIFFYINYKSNIKDNPSKTTYNVIFDGKYNQELHELVLYITLLNFFLF